MFSSAPFAPETNLSEGQVFKIERGDLDQVDRSSARKRAEKLPIKVEVEVDI